MDRPGLPSYSVPSSPRRRPLDVGGISGRVPGTCSRVFRALVTPPPTWEVSRWARIGRRLTVGQGGRANSLLLCVTLWEPTTHIPLSAF